MHPKHEWDWIEVDYHRHWKAEGLFISEYVCVAMCCDVSVFILTYQEWKRWYQDVGFAWWVLLLYLAGIDRFVFSLSLKSPIAKK